MKQFESVNEALDYAIGEEEAAAAFYEELAEKVKQPGISTIQRLTQIRTPRILIRLAFIFIYHILLSFLQRYDE